MSAIAFDHGISGGYQFHLPGFEGPLDLLLRLVERQQLPISDVSLIAVCDQFLDAVNELGLQPESLAEFAHMGSRLVLLKARALIPKPRFEEFEEEPVDLVVQLLEYRAIKEAAKAFGDWDQLGFSAFGRGPESVRLPERKPDLPLARNEPRQLVRALSRKLMTQISAPRMVAIRPMISLRVVVEHLLDSLNSRAANFTEVRRSLAGTVDDERALFLALLILVRRGQLDAQQEEPYGEIVINRLTAINPLTLTADLEEFS
jgi:segregation and condensation protein A